MKKSLLNFISLFSVLKKSTLVVTLLVLISTVTHSQVTTNSGSGLNPTYSSLDAAITALNAATITSPVTITLAGNETAPVGGYSITAQGTATNTIIIQGNVSTITASVALVAGSLTDGIFKLVGADYITLQSFIMQENSNVTTAAATNNMTEWGVALLYASATNGAQNNVIQNNAISLNRIYQNTFGIYANATHTAVLPTTAATATGTSGGNSGLKVYANSIFNVNNGIVVVGPTALADQNTGIDIGGSSLASGNAITNYGTTGTFSAYANVSGTVNGILVRNSNGTNISYNSVTSSVGGVTAGTLNGIQVAASSVAPTATFTNTINNNSISLKSGLATGAMNGINYPFGSASATSTLNLNNNDFNNFGHTTVTASGTVIFILTASTNQFTTIDNNKFTNITLNTTGSVTFISQSFSAIATATKSVTGNVIITAFNKTGAGGTVIFVTDNGSTLSGAISNCINNNFSNVTLTGATTITGINYTDGGTGTAPTRTVSGNVLNNWTTGAATINAMNFTYWNGVSALSNNTITNITGQGAITGITIGNTVATATSVVIGSNTINNLSSTGVGGAVVGITCSNTSIGISIISNAINTLSSTAALAVSGIVLTNATAGINVTQNTIYNLSNTSAAGVGIVNGIQIAGTGVGNLIQRNLIYDLKVTSTNASAEANGFKISGGTNTFRNNMIRFGSGIPNAIAVNGFNEVVGTNSIFNNSVYLEGNPAVGTANSFAFNGTQTVNVRSFRNNIFFNARSNVGATGKNYATRVGGTGVNPTGLTVNNNVYFANGTGSFVGLYGGVDLIDLASLQASVGQDANSIVANPLYVSPTDLNLQVGSPAIDVAFNLGVTNDFAGDSRPGLNTLFDIGADEKDGIALVPNDLQATAFINPTNTSLKPINVAFAPQASFTNNGTSNQTNVTVRYRIVDSALIEVYNQTFVIPSILAFASTNVTFPNATLTAIGTYTIFAKAELTADTVSSNDQITGTVNVLTPLAGTYTVGAAGNYPSLTNAGGIFEDINNRGASSNLTINIISDLTGELGTNALNEITGGFTTLIQPTGAARTITGSSASGLIKLNGADFVTINGSLGTNSKDLTITNTNVGISSLVIWNASASATNGAKDNTFKNLIVLGQAPATTFSGIFSGSGITAGGIAESTNERLTIQNNTISKSLYGIVIAGASTVEVGNVVSQNLIGSAIASDYIGRFGIFISNNNGLVVSKNSISNIVSGLGADPTGILVAANVTNSTFDSNKITNLSYTGTGGYGGHGIDVNTGNVSSNLTFSNNMISELKGDSYNSFLNDAIIGIRIGGTTGGVKLYHNSINLGSGSFAGNNLGTLSSALYIAAGVTGLDIRNNVFTTNLVNSALATAKTYAIYSDATITAFTSINNNDYATSGTQGVLGFITSARPALVDIQTGFGGNTASVNIAPVFLSTTDLHMDSVSNPTLDNLGTPIASVTIDIDGDTRSTTTPDIGADEFCTTPIAPTGSASQTFCSGATLASLVATPLAGNTIKWYAAATGGSPLVSTTVLVNGNQYFASQIVTAGGCESVLRLAVTVTLTTVIASATQVNVLCNGSSTGTATAIASGGTAPYTYAWSNGQNVAGATGLAAGTYTCVVTDANGCINSTISVTITQPATAITATATKVNALCNGSSTGTATASASGGIAPYTYAWSNGQNVAGATGLAAGTYTCVVTDANGCINSTISVTITQPATAITATATKVNVLCNGSSTGTATAIASGGTAPYTYAWSNGQNVAGATGLAAGTYTCVVTDANGCTNSTISVTITQPTAITATATKVNILCNGSSTGTATATATGGTSPYAYAWSNGQNVAGATGLAAGTYTCVVTDANGCTNSTISVTITQPATAITASATKVNVLCNGSSTGTATASASGGTAPYTYAWSNGQNVAGATGLAAGTYTCVITDANGCTNSTISVTITQPVTAITASATQVNVLCNGSSTGTATASATGGTAPYTYAWSNGQNVAIATGLVAGTYTCVVTDANGCTNSTISVTITQPATAITASATQVNVLCNGSSTGTATASATGGTSPYTYAWSSGQNVAIATGLPAGTYTCVVTDANGCTNSTISVTITQSAPVNNTVTQSAGILTATQTGATYQWYTCPSSTLISGATSQSYTPSVVGDYKVTVTVAGCPSVTSACVTIVVLGTNSFDLGTFKFYPNPVNDNLNISYSEELTSVKVINMIGQEVLSKSINATTAQIDMSFLPAGTYLVEVRSLDNFKTIKVIKK